MSRGGGLASCLGEANRKGSVDVRGGRLPDLGGKAHGFVFVFVCDIVLDVVVGFRARLECGIRPPRCCCEFDRRRGVNVARQDRLNNEVCLLIYVLELLFNSSKTLRRSIENM